MYNRNLIERLKQGATEITMAGATPEQIAQRLDSEARLGHNVYTVVRTTSNNRERSYELYSLNSPEENLAKLKVMQKMASAKKSFAIAVASSVMETMASDIINRDDFDKIQELDNIFAFAELIEKNPEEAKARYSALPGTQEEKLKKYGRVLIGAKNGKALFDTIVAGLDDKTKASIQLKCKQAEGYFSLAAKHVKDREKCAELKETMLPIWEDKVKKHFLCDRHAQITIDALKRELDNGSIDYVMEIVGSLELMDLAETASPEQLGEKLKGTFKRSQPTSAIFLQSDKAYVLIDVLAENFREDQIARYGDFSSPEEIDQDVARYKESLLSDLESVEFEFICQESKKDGNGYSTEMISEKTAARLNAMKNRPKEKAVVSNFKKKPVGSNDLESILNGNDLSKGKSKINHFGD